MLISSSIDNELPKLIQSKKLNASDITAKEIYQLYAKMILDILYNVHKVFTNTEYSITCCELAHSIFLIILHNTNNSKLAMFLCDRAKILFIEYINISYEMASKESINMIDVKLYIYSKTIGPLSLSNNKNIKISKLKNLFILYKNIIYKIYLYSNEENRHIRDNNNEDEDGNILEYIEENEENEENEGKDEDNLFSIYEDDLFYTIDTIKEKVYMKIYKCYFFIKNIYLENLLYTDHIDNIFSFINKINLHLQILIDYKNKYKPSSRDLFIHKLNKIITEINIHDYNYNYKYMVNNSIKKTKLYKHIITLI